MRGAALRLVGWSSLLIVLGFGGGRLAAATLHQRNEMIRRDAVAAWTLERDALAEELAQARREGSPAQVRQLALRLLEVDPIHVEARRALGASAPATVIGAAALATVAVAGTAGVPGPGSATDRATAGGPPAVLAAAALAAPGTRATDAMEPPHANGIVENGRPAGDGPMGRHPEILALHVKEGRTLRAARQLEKKGEHEAASKLVEIETLLREAGSHLLAKRTDAAHEKWGVAASLEARLLGGERSTPLREMGVSLAEIWNQLAEQSLARGQFREARTFWKRSLEAHPAQMEAALGEQKIEKEALRLLASAPRCADLVEIVAATAPDSQPHRQAQGQMDETCESRARGFLLYRHGD